MTAQPMKVAEEGDATEKHCYKGPSKRRTEIIISIISVVILVSLSGLSGYLIGSAEYSHRFMVEPAPPRNPTAPLDPVPPPDPVEPRKPSVSRLHMFQQAAVCTDSPRCSEVGREILLKNGSVVDAAIAAKFCNGLLNQQSMGLGGGFFMTVYIKGERKAYIVNARETAPGAAKPDMFDGSYDKATRGPLAAAVPGELRGMWVAYKRWGKLPWASLVAPSLAICKTGFPMSKVMYDSVKMAGDNIKNDAHLRDMESQMNYFFPRKMYFDSVKGQFYKPGTMVKPSEALCTTFQRIAEKGGDDLYNGTLAVDFLDDLKQIGSIITAEDLSQYEAKILDPITVPIGNGDILYTPPPPSGGVILVNILNILRGYHFNSTSINTTEDKVLTYHRILEAFKYAYATRTKLGDPDFLNLEKLVQNVTSPEYGTEIRLRINDTATSNDTATYGASEYTPPDSGTAHISIIATNGDAVSVTSSINYYYGAGFTTLKTGIVMNNVMDDFSSRGITNFYGLKPSSANSIAPHKRPQSSMSPTIIVDRNSNVKMVIGASGGTKITTAVAWVAIRKLWFEQTVKEAVDEARIHHQITPMHVQYEFGVPADIVQGLREKGHGMVPYVTRGSAVCALYRNQTAIYANADFRKGGDVTGMD